MASLVLPFAEISAGDLPYVGGKGANLGEMARAGFPVPPGFCVTTAAFQQFMAACPDREALYAALEALAPGDVAATRRAGAQARARLRQVAIPTTVEKAILAAWEAAGRHYPYAIRSSATAEDLPNASFAGQQDTFLNVHGPQALLESVRNCWISLFTDRAILYRIQSGFPHRDVFLSVVVQRMVLPEVSGILFTADPVSGHRHIASIDASFGLGEALVAGLVSADLYKVDRRNYQVIEARVADKRLAIWPAPEGGTVRQELKGKQRSARVLADEYLVLLTEIGSRIEAHYGRPQDIEWCIENGRIHILQSRPITSLYPLPRPRPADSALHIYISISHAQVMTDPMPPMALSLWRLILPFGKPGPSTSYNPYVTTAGGRLYADLSLLLRLRPFRRFLPRLLTNADQIIARTVAEVMERDEFKHSDQQEQNKASLTGVARWILPMLLKAQARLWWYPPEGTTAALAARNDTFVEQVQTRLEAAAPGSERLRVACDLMSKLFVEMALTMPPYLVAGILARMLLVRLVQKRGDPGDVERLLGGLSGNVTTEMDLEVGDLADIARRSPALVQHLCTGDGVEALETAASVAGSEAFLAAWNHFLEKYGARGPSEIDISRPRWRENPASLLQAVIGNLQHHEAGRHRAQYRRIVAAAEAAAERLVTAARRGPLGAVRAAIVRRLMRVARHLLPIREHPKFLIIRMLALIKQVILETAVMLQQPGRIDAIDDVWFLGFLELIDVLENPAQDLRPRIAQRRAAFKRFHHLTPPRVITSDGEMPVAKRHNEHLPAGALAGSPVSAGVVEGIARVIRDPNSETLSPGEILVAPFTDPGWTPLFINAAGLVMEVGGIMTHGSVVAREYGIPAVVGVVDATRQIESGQRIRVHGDLGYVELL